MNVSDGILLRGKKIVVPSTLLVARCMAKITPITRGQLTFEAEIPLERDGSRRTKVLLRVFGLS